MKSHLALTCVFLLSLKESDAKFRPWKTEKMIEKLSSHNAKMATLEKDFSNSQTAVSELDWTVFLYLINNRSRPFKTLLFLYNGNYQECKLCQEGKKNFEKVAHLYKDDYPENNLRIYFVAMDIDLFPFQAEPLLIEDRTLCKIYYLPSFKEKEYGDLKAMEDSWVFLKNRKAQIEAIVSWVNHVAATTISSPTQNSSVMLFMIISFLTFVGCISIIKFQDSIKNFVSSKSIACYCVLAVEWLCSGQMYNSIKNAPAYYYDQKGSFHFIASGRRQFVLESWLALVLQVLLTFGFMKIIEGRRKLLKWKEELNRFPMEMALMELPEDQRPLFHQDYADLNSPKDYKELFEGEIFLGLVCSNVGLVGLLSLIPRKA